MQPKLKFIPESSPKNIHNEDYYGYAGYKGFIEIDDNPKKWIVFTINIAPEEDRNYVKIRSIKREINMWQTVLDMVKLFKVKMVENDFYWRETDLLIRVYVDPKHPLLKAEYNRHYVTLQNNCYAKLSKRRD